MRKKKEKKRKLKILNYQNMKMGGVFNETVISVRNKIDDLISNLGYECVSLHVKALGKRHESICSTTSYR